MKVAIWNTYVKRKDAVKEIQFDIVVPKTMNDLQTIIEFGLEYIRTKPFETWGLSSSECSSCKVDEKHQDKITNAIIKKGYAIQELENCN